MRNRIGIFASLAGVSCAVSGLAAAQDQRLAVPLTDPSRPARLEIALFSGDISVEGYEGNEVVIVADTPIRGADDQEPPRPDGLRRIQSSAVGLTVEENDNTVTVHMDFSPNNADIEIRVPRRTSVKARTIEGELVAKSVSDTPSPFNVGDRVFHMKFGNGNVSAIEGNKLTIAFDKAGEKRVVDSFVERV